MYISASDFFEKEAKVSKAKNSCCVWGILVL